MDKINQGLLDFLARSPTPFHAVAEMKKQLQAAGFNELREADCWQTQQPGKYFVTRNDSSIIAFNLSDKPLSESGFRMVGAHTDSPCLQVKPNPEIVRNGFLQLGVEVYGGALFNPWFDRDLSLAGRVNYLNEQGALVSALIDFEQPMAVIHSLAIHLDREANTGRTVNAQEHLPPIIMQTEDAQDFRKLLLQQLAKQGVAARQVLDYQLSFYDTQAPAIIGFNQEFIASARLDNLLSCYIGLQSLLAADDRQNILLVCNDHEEVGSQSAEGAQGSMLPVLLQRLTDSVEEYARTIDRSMFISADNAHGIHPNYLDKHDQNHGPLLNQGPVIKINAKQRYATNSETASRFRKICLDNDVPVQSFVVRSDMGCGSTIGPITASQLGIKTVDLGVPTFAMHSIREMAGSSDTTYLLKALTAFFSDDLT